MNGWKNEATWKFQLHLANDRQLYATANQAAARIAMDAATFEDAVEAFARWLAGEWSSRPRPANPSTWDRLTDELAEAAWRQVELDAVARSWIATVRLSRDEFEHLVDAAVLGAAGVSLYDLPDVSLDGWLDDTDHIALAGARQVARDAALEILADAGYPAEVAHG